MVVGVDGEVRGASREGARSWRRACPPAPARALRVSAREKMLMVEALHAGRRRADAVLPNLRYQNGKKSDESGVMSGAAGYDFRRKYNGVQKSKSEQQQVETVEETKGKKGRGKKGKKRKGGEDERSRDDSSSSPSTTKDEL